MSRPSAGHARSSSSRRGLLEDVDLRAVAAGVADPADLRRVHPEGRPEAGLGLHPAAGLVTAEGVLVLAAGPHAAGEEVLALLARLDQQAACTVEPIDRGDRRRRGSSLGGISHFRESSTSPSNSSVPDELPGLAGGGGRGAWSDAGGSAPAALPWTRSRRRGGQGEEGQGRSEQAGHGIGSGGTAASLVPPHPRAGRTARRFISMVWRRRGYG